MSPHIVSKYIVISWLIYSPNKVNICHANPTELMDEDRGIPNIIFVPDFHISLSVIRQTITFHQLITNIHINKLIQILKPQEYDFLSCYMFASYKNYPSWDKIPHSSLQNIKCLSKYFEHTRYLLKHDSMEDLLYYFTKLYT